MTQIKKVVQELIEQVSRTQEEELDCGQVFEWLDVYAEATARGEDASALLPLVKQHLDLCRDCAEEYEALLRVLQAEAPQT